QGKKDYREGVVRAYERLTDEQKASWFGMMTQNYLNPVKTVSCGAPAPDYAYVDKEGKTVRISDFKGKWVLMDFWGSGCGPCLMAIPELAALSREMQDKLVVVSINLDRESVWKKVSKEHGITWTDWNDPKGASGGVRAYGTAGLPTFVMVSPDGVIKSIQVGYRTGSLREMVQSAQ
nr:TlpA family protein disulfide reductase [Bacteroidales bacterium]